jgi:tripartite-type tricarboxylate transporter receptor subunit TctC
MHRANTFAAAAAWVWLALTAAPSVAQAQQAEAWPQRPVRLLVPFGAGSATDVTARLFADRLSQRWSQPVVVENRPGGDSNIAVGAFASGRDDHTILYSAPNPITVNPILYDKLPYDPAQDLVPISFGSEIFIVVAAPESLKLNSLPDLVALARAQPGKLNWVATPGVVYYMFAGFVRSAGLQMSQVPYRDFTQAVNDLAEGRIQVTVTSLATARPQVETGKVKLLAVTNQQRIPARPEIQTVTEAGHPELAFGAFGGFFGWRGITNELREKISADIRAVGTDPIIAERLGAAGIRPRTSTPAEFAAAIEEERSKVAEIARALGTKPQ